MESLIGWAILYGMLVVSIVVHEAAHALMMWKLRIPIEKMFIGFPPFLWVGFLKLPPIGFGPIPLIGGVEPSGDYDSRPWHHRALIAIVGPLSSFVLGLLLFVIAVKISPNPSYETLYLPITADNCNL